MLQLRPAQRVTHAGGVLSSSAVPPTLSHSSQLQPVPWLERLGWGMAALRLEHGTAAGVTHSTVNSWLLLIVPLFFGF